MGLPCDELTTLELDPSPQEIPAKQLKNLRYILNFDIEANEIDVPHMELFDCNGNMYDFSPFKGELEWYFKECPEESTPDWLLIC